MKQAIENLSVSVPSMNPSHKEAELSVGEKSIELNVPVGTAYDQWTQLGKRTILLAKSLKGWKEI